MDETCQNAKRGRRGGAALGLAVLLAFFSLTIPAAAAETTAARTLVPVGHTAGIKLFARGVVVVKLSDGASPAKACGLRTGDIILSCGGTGVTSTEQFQSLLQSGAGVELKVRRGGGVEEFSVQPTRNDEGVWCIGAWIRDSMAGIGTLTFYDPDTGVFGALGHGITDTDTALLMPFSSGTILPSTVKAVKKGAVGTAGELKGDFDLTSTSGTLYANTSGGIFGTCEEAPAEDLGDPVPVAAPDEVETGPAVILSNVEGDEVREYAVEITTVFDRAGDGRDLLVTVKDPELLAVTGGIVQGMSGSPILQNGKLVGAVTHVLLNDPTRGYGIFADSMLKQAENCRRSAA